MVIMITTTTEQENSATFNPNRLNMSTNLSQINPVDAFILLINSDEKIDGRRVLDLDYSKGLFTWDALEKKRLALAKKSVETLGVEMPSNSPVVIQELEEFDLPDIGLMHSPNSMDGIWALRALMYLRKYKMGPMLKVFHEMLVPWGSVCMSVYEGQGEVAIRGSWKRGFSDGVVSLWPKQEIGQLFAEFGFEERSTKTISGTAGPIDEPILLYLLGAVK